MTSRRVAALAAGALCAAGIAIAQQPSPTPVRESVTVHRVEITLHVTDRSGAAVQGIEPREFSVFVDGQHVDTESVEWVASGRAAAAQLPAVLAAELPLPRLLALCERAHSMISVDTGPAHAAAALSLPLVVLFGAHSQAEWLPRSPSGSAVVGVGGPPHSSRLDHIAVPTVLEAWRGLEPRPTTAHATGS